jgi:8-oxo-dGTP pyrophosphatase MutT (NUDIX family)
MSNDPSAAPLTPAATVLVVRDGATGLESLMLKRSSQGAFGGHWVFPGGKVDSADHDLSDTDELTPFRRAAVREASEEADMALSTGDLVTFSYWEPPVGQPKRFATWFFLAAAPTGNVTVDGHEIHDHAWLAPAEVLARRDAGEVELAPPTWMSLYTLSHYATTADLLSSERSRETPRFATRMGKLDDVRLTMWMGDAGYATGDTSLPGERNRLVMYPTGWRYEGSFPGRAQG